MTTQTRHSSKAKKKKTAIFVRSFVQWISLQANRQPSEWLAPTKNIQLKFRFLKAVFDGKCLQSVWFGTRTKCDCIRGMWFVKCLRERTKRVMLHIYFQIESEMHVDCRLQVQWKLFENELVMVNSVTDEQSNDWTLILCCGRFLSFSFFRFFCLCLFEICAINFEFSRTPKRKKKHMR